MGPSVADRIGQRTEIAPTQTAFIRQRYNWLWVAGGLNQPVLAAGRTLLLAAHTPDYPVVAAHKHGAHDLWACASAILGLWAAGGSSEPVLAAGHTLL